MKTKKITNLITTSMMASALIFSYGGSAFANEDTTATGTALTEETTTVQSTVVESDVTTTETTQEGATVAKTAETEATTTDTITAETDEQLEGEAPALVPGDFFYFVKTFMEKIRLSVTLDEFKEAQLLAEFATERIAEANALIAEGKTEEAAKLLQDAIATQETASKVLDQTKEEATNDDTQKEAEVATEETTKETSVTTEETVQVDEPEAEEDVVVVKSKLSHNIDALVAAAQKIDNPRAQEALMKNIEKSFAKLSKKIKKLEKKNGTEEVTIEEEATVEGTNNENPVDETTVENNVENEENIATEKQETANTEVKEETTIVVAPVKAVKTETSNKESVQAKVEAKQQQIIEKQQAVKAKVEEKKNRVQAKVEEKKQAIKAKVEEKKNENARKE